MQKAHFWKRKCCTLFKNAVKVYVERRASVEVQKNVFAVSVHPSTWRRRPAESRALRLMRGVFDFVCICASKSLIATPVSQSNDVAEDAPCRCALGEGSSRLEPPRGVLRKPVKVKSARQNAASLEARPVKLGGVSGCEASPGAAGSLVEDGRKVRENEVAQNVAAFVEAPLFLGRLKFAATLHSHTFSAQPNASDTRRTSLFPSGS